MMTLKDMFTLVRTGVLGFCLVFDQERECSDLRHYTNAAVNVTEQDLLAIDEVIRAHANEIAHLVATNDITMCGDPGIHAPSYCTVGQFTYCKECEAMRQELRAFLQSSILMA